VREISAFCRCSLDGTVSIQIRASLGPMTMPTFWAPFSTGSWGLIFRNHPITRPRVADRHPMLALGLHGRLKIEVVCAERADSRFPKHTGDNFTANFGRVRLRTASIRLHGRLAGLRQ
jgi:hypothetical protein